MISNSSLPPPLPPPPSPPLLMASPPLHNPACLVTDNSHLFGSRNHFPATHTAQLPKNLISDQNLELCIVETEAPRTKIIKQQQSRDLVALITYPNPYDKLLSMYLCSQLSQEAEYPDPCTPLANDLPKNCVLVSPHRLKKPCQESTCLTSQSENPPNGEGLQGSSILNDSFPEPPSSVTGSFGVGVPELYIQEEDDEPITSSVFSSLNNALTPEVDRAIFSLKTNK